MAVKSQLLAEHRETSVLWGEEWRERVTHTLTRKGCFVPWGSEIREIDVSRYHPRDLVTFTPAGHLQNLRPFLLTILYNGEPVQMDARRADAAMGLVVLMERDEHGMTVIDYSGVERQIKMVLRFGRVVIRYDWERHLTTPPRERQEWEKLK